MVFFGGDIGGLERRVKVFLVLVALVVLVAVLCFTRSFLQGSGMPRSSVMTVDLLTKSGLIRSTATLLEILGCTIFCHGHVRHFLSWSCPCAPHYAKERGEDYYGIGKHLKWVACL